MHEIWKAADAAAWTAVALGGFLPLLSEEKREALARLCPQAQTVFVAAFPYFAGIAPGNIALYARGEDYHRVLARRLERVCASLRELYPAHRFVAAADASPLPEQDLAMRGGLGQRGLHQLLILPEIGSYHVLGTVICDLPFAEAWGKDCEAPGLCRDCGACLRACPTGAISREGFVPTRCLSHISQKKGELSEWEQAALRRAPRCWGCDLCQLACPCNRAVPQTKIAEFREALLSTLHRSDAEALTQKQFRARYGSRAFAWRGVAVLRRNLILQEQQEEDTSMYKTPPNRPS